MTVLYPNPLQQFFDDDGNPLSGGFVYTYAAGTSTPLATYTDETGNDPNTNPVVLNAAGRPEFGIWYGSSLYKIVITDSQGTQLKSIDNFPGSNSGGGSATSWPGAAVNVPSATLVDLGAAGSNFVQITGTVTVDDFGSTASLDNPLYLLKFNGTLTITNSSDILIRSGVTAIGSDLLTANGDHALVEYLGSGSWKIFAYFRDDGSLDATTVNCVNLVETGT